MVRQDGVLQEAPAGKLVEVLAGIGRPVHLPEQPGRRLNAAVSETDSGDVRLSGGGQLPPAPTEERRPSPYLEAGQSEVWNTLQTER